MEEKILDSNDTHSQGRTRVKMVSNTNNVVNKKKKKRYITYGVIGLYLLGVLFGNLMIRISSSQSSQFVTDIVKNQFAQTKMLTFGGVLINSITATLGIIILLYLLGFFALSQVFTAVCVMAKGMVFGSMASFIIRQYGIKGMVYIMLTQLITTVMMILLLALSARESVMFSVALLKRARNPKIVSIDIKLYNLRFLVFMFFGIVIAFAESVFTILFRGYIVS